MAVIKLYNRLKNSIKGGISLTQSEFSTLFQNAFNYYRGDEGVYYSAWKRLVEELIKESKVEGFVRSFVERDQSTYNTARMHLPETMKLLDLSNLIQAQIVQLPTDTEVQVVEGDLELSWYDKETDEQYWYRIGNILTFHGNAVASMNEEHKKMLAEKEQLQQRISELERALGLSQHGFRV